VRVLVTGAAGHMGYNLCRALLARGSYEVRASVRSKDDAAKADPVRALGDLEVVGLDARDPDAFDKALAGVEVLFHVAAPYVVFTGKERGEAIVREGVEGATTAIRAAARAGVRKVVLTSSIVALPMVRPGDPPATEDQWATDLQLPYVREKVEAEQAAWQLAGELGVHLVTVLPGGLGGPGFLRRTPTFDIFEGILLGALRFGAPDGNFTWVDVRDCAEGHVLAAEKDVRGRFTITNDENPSWAEYSRLFHEIEPSVPVAPVVLPQFMNAMFPFFDALNAKVLGTARVATPEGMASTRGLLYVPSNARARRELGWEPKIPLRQSLAAFVESVRAVRRSEGKTRFV